MTEKLDISDFIIIGEGNRAFEKHRRALVHSASTEQLLSLRLELTETIGILELHSRSDNSVTAWYVRKLVGVLAMIEDMAISRRRRKRGWD